MSRCTLRNLYASNIWIIWSWSQGCSIEVSYKLITSYFWQLESKFLKKMNHSKSTWEFWLWINLKCIIEFWLTVPPPPPFLPQTKTQQSFGSQCAMNFNSMANDASQMHAWSTSFRKIIFHLHYYAFVLTLV